MFEFLEENKHVAYPFVDQADNGFNGFFVDAYIIYTQNANTGRVRLHSFSTTEVILKFEDNSSLCDLVHGVGGVVRTSYTFGNFIVYRWVKLAALDTTSAWFTSEEFVVQFVVTTATASYPITPTLAYLDSSLVTRVPIQVRKIAIKTPGTAFPSDLPHITPLLAQGCCQINVGSNMKVSPTTPALTDGLGLSTIAASRPFTNILFEAVPGAGTGAVSECIDEDLSIKTIKNQGASLTGNFSLLGDACVWLERTLNGGGTSTTLPHVDYQGVVHPNLLKVNSNCKACCDCTDYGAAYTALTQVWNAAKLVAIKVADLNKRYEALRAKRLASADCTQPCVKIKLAVFARPDFSLAISAVVQNDCSIPLTTSSLFITVAGGDGGNFEAGSGFLVLPGRAALQVDGIRDGFPLLATAIVPVLQPGERATYSFNRRWNSDPRLNLIVNVQAELFYVTDGRQEHSFYDSVAVALRGPLVKT